MQVQNEEKVPLSESSSPSAKTAPAKRSATGGAAETKSDSKSSAESSSASPSSVSASSASSTSSSAERSKPEIVRERRVRHDHYHHREKDGGAEKDVKPAAKPARASQPHYLVCLPDGSQRPFRSYADAYKLASRLSRRTGKNISILYPRRLDAEEYDRGHGLDGSRHKGARR